MATVRLNEGEWEQFHGLAEDWRTLFGTWVKTSFETAGSTLHGILHGSVFDEWYCNAYTQRAGITTLPLVPSPVDVLSDEQVLWCGARQVLVARDPSLFKTQNVRDIHRHARIKSIDPISRFVHENPSQELDLTVVVPFKSSFDLDRSPLTIDKWFIVNVLREEDDPRNMLTVRGVDGLQIGQIKLQCTDDPALNSYTGIMQTLWEFHQPTLARSNFLESLHGAWLYDNFEIFSPKQLDTLCKLPIIMHPNYTGIDGVLTEKA